MSVMCSEGTSCSRGLVMCRRSMLYALLMLALAGCPAESGPSPAGSRGAGDEARRMSGAHVSALRRQLMRNNYDYNDDEPRDNHTASDQQNSSELGRPNSKASSSESDQRARAPGHRPWREYDEVPSGEHEHPSRRTLQHDQRRHARPQDRHQAYRRVHSWPEPHGNHNDPDGQSGESSEDNPKELEQIKARRADQLTVEDYDTKEQHSDSDDKRLRHRDMAAAPRNRAAAPRQATPAPPGLPHTKHPHRNAIVTLSTTNVTYKLLKVKSRDGRRRGVRRLVEERGPGGVAIISVDGAPPRPLRLPRARKQYMRAER